MPLYLPGKLQPAAILPLGLVAEEPHVVLGVKDDWIALCEGGRREINALQGIREQLADLGVIRAALFPDMDGIAASINWGFSGADSEQPGT
jgi:hypothetical protein